MATRAIAFSGFAFTSVSFICLCVTTFNGFYLLSLRPVLCRVSYLRPSQTAFSGFAYGEYGRDQTGSSQIRRPRKDWVEFKTLRREMFGNHWRKYARKKKVQTELADTCNEFIDFISFYTFILLKPTRPSVTF